MFSRWFSHFSSLSAMALLGFAIAFTVVATRPAMTHAQDAKKAKAVLTVSAKSYPVKPQIIGYGEVKPDVLLDTRAEVSGKLTYVHPLLRQGNFLPKGAVVIKIDPRDHQLALTQAKADLAASEANLKEAELSLESAKADLDIASQKLQIQQKEWKRMQKLAKKARFRHQK